MLHFDIDIVNFSVLKRNLRHISGFTSQIRWNLFLLFLLADFLDTIGVLTLSASLDIKKAIKRIVIPNKFSMHTINFDGANPAPVQKQYYSNSLSKLSQSARRQRTSVRQDIEFLIAVVVVVGVVSQPVCCSIRSALLTAGCGDST